MFILLHGPDEFTAHEELARLKAENDVAYSTDMFSGMEGDLEAILAACNTLPFLSERRLVVIEGLPKRRRTNREAAESIEAATERESVESVESSLPVAERVSASGIKRRKSKDSTPTTADPKAFMEALARSVPEMPASTLLVVILDELLDALSPLVKVAHSHGMVKVCTAPRGTELEAWLIRRARDAGRDLTPEAAHILAVENGDSLRLLASEIDKLSTYVGLGGQIGTEAVRALTQASQKTRIFDLTDALVRRDRRRGLALLHELLDSGESPLGIVALTALQTRSLLQVKALSQRGMRVAEISATAGIAPFVVERLLPLARQFSWDELESTHRMLRDIDSSLKRSKMTPEMALDLLVIEFGTVTHRG